MYKAQYSNFLKIFIFLTFTVSDEKAHAIQKLKIPGIELFRAH